jgi:hypothetical protein
MPLLPARLFARRRAERQRGASFQGVQRTVPENVQTQPGKLGNQPEQWPFQAGLQQFLKFL